MFKESLCSGRNLKNFWTRIGGARNCLLVYVADGKLSITPIFPLNLGFLPDIYGLEITAPIGAVRFEEKQGVFRYSIVLTVEGPRQQSFELWMRNGDGLRRALHGDR